MSEQPMDPDDAAPTADADAAAADDLGRHLHHAVPVGPGTPSTSGGRSRPRDGDLMSAPGDAPGLPAPQDAGDAQLLALVDRLSAILEKGDLAELEVSTGDTTIIVRSPAAVERVTATAFVPPTDGGAAVAAAPSAPAAATSGAPSAAPAKPSVKAPLTGIFYGAPSPGATPYVAVGDHVSVGQIIGLIEAMKLFNEIKSDLAGRVTKICADNGQLVKAKSPLIEVEPA
jgi:acetyl-CoA carboxylase biotin carboxyl carrier protein